MTSDPDHEAKTALAHKIATEVARMKGELSDARMEIATLREALEDTHWEVVISALDKWSRDGGSDLVALGVIGQGLLVLDEKRRAALAKAKQS
jgi:hypothetical protein